MARRPTGDPGTRRPFLRETTRGLDDDDDDDVYNNNKSIIIYMEKEGVKSVCVCVAINQR